MKPKFSLKYAVLWMRFVSYFNFNITKNGEGEGKEKRIDEVKRLKVEKGLHVMDSLMDKNIWLS